MEEISMDSSVENIPLKNVKNIILEFEKSGVSDEAFEFNKFGEDKSNVESRIEKDVTETRLLLEENEIKNNDEKDDLGLLFERDLSDIDFEISKDMFDDIKIKEEDIIFDEKVSSQLANGSEKNINFKLPFFNENLDVNRVTSVDSEIKIDSKEPLNKNFVDENHQMEIVLEDSLEIDFSSKTEKNKIRSSSNNDLKIIMAELQVIHENNDYLRSNDNNCISKVLVNYHEPVGNTIIDEEKWKESIFSAEENVSSLTQESAVIGDNTDMIGDNSDMIGNNTDIIEGNTGMIGDNTDMIGDNSGIIGNNTDIIVGNTDMIGDNTDMILNTKVDLKSQEDNTLSDAQSYDSISATIESVIQASLQQDLDSNDLTIQGAINGKQDEKKIPYGVFEVVLPLIGKNVMRPGNDVPFPHRYDLARKCNEMRAKFQKNDPNFPIPNMSFEEWRKMRESRTKEEIAAEERIKVINAKQLARCFTKIAINILLEYEKNEPNQVTMTKYFRYFELAPASPLSLLYAPHFVHTMMLCRGDNDLSPNLRKAANDCFDKCHALFPLPEGYNFETVYTSEVKKYVPDDLDKLSDLVLDYGDYDSSDFEDDASDSSSDTDKDWE